MPDSGHETVGQALLISVAGVGALSVAGLGSLVVRSLDTLTTTLRLAVLG